MKKKMIVIALLLGGCVSEVSLPVSGVIGKQPAQGQATARTSGAGSFWVMTTSGLRCEGTYDSLTNAPTITAPTICNDGRTGNLIITRTLDLVSGTVIGQLNDGTKGQFVFGNLTFEQAFGAGSVRIKN